MRKRSIIQQENINVTIGGAIVLEELEKADKKESKDEEIKGCA